MGIRIRELELINFTNLYVGMGITNLLIDFSKQTNVVCVIIGENGRGKTSLLSYMTPFAGIGNIEARDNSKLILPKKKGYKRIVIEDDQNHIYEIQHHYQPEEKDSHTIKSYISVDGTEMNSNGNVTSFKALVSEYLGIEQEYLKLIRVGDNVQSLIKSKDTERKVFMGRILEDVSIYLKQHKKISKISTEVDAIIGHIMDSISKTGVADVSATKIFIGELRDEISELTAKLDRENDSKSRVQYEIDTIAFPSDGALTIRELEKKILKYEKLREEYASVSSAEIADEIRRKDKEIISKNATISASRDKFNFITDEIDSLNNKKRNLELELHKEEVKLNLTTMREHVANLQKQVNFTYEVRFDEDRPEITKSEYDEFVVLLRNIQTQLDRMYEFGKNVVSDVASRIMANEDVSSLVKSSLILLESTNRADKFALIDRLIDKYAGRTYNCPESGKCTYKMLYDELLSIKDAVPVDSVTKDESYYYAMKSVNDILHDVLDIIRDNADRLLKKLPQELLDIFNTEIMFNHIKKCEVIYDDTVVNKWASFITDIDNYDKLVKTLYEEQEKVRSLEESSHETYLKKQLSELEESYKELVYKQSVLDGEIYELTDKVEGLEHEMQNLMSAKDAAEKYESTKADLNDLVMRQTNDAEAREKLRVHSIVASEISGKIQKYTEQERIAVTSLERYEKLQKELAIYLEIQEDYKQLKYGLSNRSGLPLFNIELYLQDTVRIANELLDIVYDGSIYLCEFEISDNEFRMPYVKNGIKAPDVITASQGEQSFFNMAISSALRAQSMEKYNVALFDEVDGVFDENNRQKVIPVLEKQLELSKITQAFLITHNNMFNQYPTDVIDFDNLDASTLPIKWS